jgi:hypothetical protein
MTSTRLKTFLRETQNGAASRRGGEKTTRPKKRAKKSQNETARTTISTTNTTLHNIQQPDKRVIFYPNFLFALDARG